MPDIMRSRDHASRKVRLDVLGELPRLRCYARVLTCSDIDSEDLVHDALVRAYEKRASFRAGHDFRIWLLSILYNVFVDGVRARGTEARRPARAGELATEQLPPDQDHHVRFCQRRQAFFGLSWEQRAALYLVAIEGMSYAHAAAALCVPVGTLMSRVARARVALQGIEECAPAASADTAKKPCLRVVGGRDEPQG
jgi:RNA polymerase sigma-70 factor (ECF subfamily)